jgi:DNA-binding NtrC family response regulator
VEDARAEPCRFAEDGAVTETRLRGLRIDPRSPTPLAEITEAVPWRSASWNAALHRARRFARVRSPVLIHGESGTGKSAFAEILHRHGPGPAAPFVRLNCAALPSSLLASELFGHVRGAFTGAETDRPGLLRAAGRGTVLLDEIDKAPRSLQGALLLVLDRDEVRPVGASDTFRIGARLLFATNRPARALAADASFLPDLFFRIAPLQVHVPPVRERREDFDLLLALALRTLRAEGLAGLRVAADARALLHAHAWPGNVRELFGTLRAAALLRAGSGPIDAAALREAAGDAPLSRHLDRAREASDLASKVRRLERDEILLALRVEAGNQARAAERLGLSRRGLNKKIHRHRLVDLLEREELVDFRTRPPGRAVRTGGRAGTTLARTQRVVDTAETVPLREGAPPWNSE